MYFMYLYKDYVRICHYMYFKVSNFYQIFFQKVRFKSVFVLNRKLTIQNTLLEYPPNPNDGLNANLSCCYD